MFRLVISDPSIFKTTFQAISAIVDEVQIEIDSDGLRLNAIDKSHITFINLDLKERLFDIYQNDKPTKLNLDTRELMQVLKRSKTDDVLELTSDGGNLVLTFEGSVKKTFKVRLIDLDYDTPTAPSIDYPVTIPIPISTLKEAIGDIAVVAEKVAISIDGDNVCFTALGDFSDAEVKYLHGESIPEVVKSVYSILNIQEMLKAEKFSDHTILSLGNDMPLTLSLRLLNDEGELNFLLAPRIED